MTIDEAPDGPARLAFGATFSAAFKAVFGNLGMMLKAAILPFVLSLAFGIVGFGLIAGAGLVIGGHADRGVVAGLAAAVLAIAMHLVGLLPYVLLGIAWSRLVLIGRQAGALPRPLFGRRTLVSLGYALLFLLALVLPAILFNGVMALSVGPMSGGAAVILPDGAPQHLGMRNPAAVAPLVPLFFIFFAVYLYVVTRLSLVFPAVAVDRKLGLGGAWRLTRGASGFKLYALLVVITILMTLCMMIASSVTSLASSFIAVMVMGTNFYDSPDWTRLAVTALPMFIIGLLFVHLSMALIIAAIAKAYATLSGWVASRAEIPARAE